MRILIVSTNTNVVGYLMDINQIQLRSEMKDITNEFDQETICKVNEKYDIETIRSIPRENYPYVDLPIVNREGTVYLMVDVTHGEKGQILHVIRKSG